MTLESRVRSKDSCPVWGGGGVVLADRHMPSEQCGARKMAALRH